ncbi:alpha-(1,6)-fucosyltransferase-like [Amphibalanus amphitrite]|uniref:alpha-(1,6)-fucosyltransferase-like n=1 Tax=Amphibalanus amphitrite TaxID=1232801 RepID=UPI001C91B2BE|nr:alpha-(1,6)-fucosyltransferase-like [Amphibalanus amphitrite]
MAAAGTWYVRVLLFLAAVWVVVVFLTVGPLSLVGGGGGSSGAVLVGRLNAAVSQLAELRRQNDELRQMLVDFTEISANAGNDNTATIQKLKHKLAEAPQRLSMSEPSLEYELARRQSRRDADELWRFVRGELTAWRKDDSAKAPPVARRLEKLQDSVRQYHAVIRGDLANLTVADGWETWRRREADQLGDLMRRRIDFLQNPPDCATAKKLVCNLNKVCGFGCQLHHVAYCLTVAYGTGRTLVLNSRNWRYNRAGWEQVFQPLSGTCQDTGGRSKAAWPGTADTQVLTLPIIDVVSPRPPYLPLAVPADLADRLARLHGDPSVWFTAQFVRYLMRPQQHLQNDLDAFVKRVQLRNPCVGIHVRRTDKVGTEAAFHPIEEYMQHVHEFYERRQMEAGGGDGSRRCVYLASDDPSVFQDAVNKFPDYTFLGDPSVSKTAAVSSRYTDASLRGVITDIHALSLTDHLVCTFSSQVCRVAYELMQTMHVDAADWFTSLDDIYYYGGQSPHEQTARFAHQPADGSEIALSPGDTVGIAGNHWNGYSKGENRRLKKVGLYPAYKTRDKLRVVEFPRYPEVPLVL